MKLKQISVLLMASIVLISGCSNGNSNAIPSITSSENTVGEISDPMKTSDTSQQASPSSSYGLSFGADADFYGVCDFLGNYEIYRKDGIYYSQVCGKTALWGDRHVDVINGQIPSGEIVLYSNGKFTKIKPENSLESQDVFLTGENEFFTSSEGSDVLKQYLNGKKTGEISLGEGNSADAVIRAGNVIFANVIDDSGSKLKFRELSR